MGIDIGFRRQFGSPPRRRPIGEKKRTYNKVVAFAAAQAANRAFCITVFTDFEFAAAQAANRTRRFLLYAAPWFAAAQAANRKQSLGPQAGAWFAAAQAANEILWLDEFHSNTFAAV